MAQLVTSGEIGRAARAIQGRVVRTPSVVSPALSAYLGTPVVLKLESLQRTGSFKPRGIYNKLLSLQSTSAAGLVTVSGGNHGLALAQIAAELAIPATIVMSRAVPEAAKKQVEAAGARLLQTDDVKQAFELAESMCEEHRLTYIHAYDDPLIIAGHGTVGRELLEDHPDLTDIVVSIGGGGLISGVAVAARSVNPKIRVWGVEPTGAPTMSVALRQGSPTVLKTDTIATTLAPPSVANITLQHVRELVEEVFVVPDQDALSALRVLIESAKIWAEPAAAFTVVAAQQVLQRVRSEPVRLGLVICGGNATLTSVAQWMKDR